MAYTKYHENWEDYPATTTPITEAALEWMESGIAAAAATADAAIAKAIVDAKGDLIVATAADTVARKAVRDIELAFKRVVETGSKDWFRANTESSIYQMIVGYYREVGDEGRATLLEKRYQRLLRIAERGAL